MSALTDLIVWFAEWSIVMAVMTLVLIAYIVLGFTYWMMRAWGCWR